MEASEKFGTLFMLTKAGYLFVFDILSGKTIFMNRISANTIFTSCRHSATDGLLGINTIGQVLAVSIDETNIVPYITTTLQDIDLALSVARQGNLPGAEQLVQQLFAQALATGNYAKAAEVAATSPGGILRGAATIQRLKAVPTAPGQPSPLLQYFSILLDSAKLNELESLELARPVLQQGKKALIEKWLEEDKVSLSFSLTFSHILSFSWELTGYLLYFVGSCRPARNLEILHARSISAWRSSSTTVPRSSTRSLRASPRRSSTTRSSRTRSRLAISPTGSTCCKTSLPSTLREPSALRKCWSLLLVVLWSIPTMYE